MPVKKKPSENNHHDSKASSHSDLLPWLKRNLTTIKGLCFLGGGLLLIGITSKVIIQLLMLLAGGFLVYSGLHILKLKTVTTFIDEVLKHMKSGS